MAGMTVTGTGVGKDAYGNPIATNPYGTPGAGYPGGTGFVGLPNPQSQAGADAAQKAVTGLQSAGPGMAGTTPYTQGGAGSSYSVGPGGVSYTVTPNLIPQETASASELSAQQAKQQGGLSAQEAAQAQTLAAQQASASQTLAKQQADAEAALASEKAGLSGKAFDQRFAAISPYLGGGPGGGPGGSVPFGMNGGDGFAQNSSALDAAFARAKDQAAGTAAGALKGLQGAMASRGLMGSTGPQMESGGIADIMGGAARGLDDVSTQQAISQANRYGQILDELYQGGITQRGQNLSALTGLMGSLGPLY